MGRIIILIFAAAVAVLGSLNWEANALASQPRVPEPKAEDAATVFRDDQADRDLRAQEEMARWAFWMFVATTATVLISAAGLILIWRTLLHTGRAANHAKDMLDEARITTAAAQLSAQASLKMANAERAWLIGDEFHHGPMNNTILNGETVNHGLIIIPNMKNIGRSPAVRVTAWRSLAFTPWGAPPPEFSTNVSDLGDGVTLGPGRFAGLEPLYMNDDTAQAFRSRRTVIYIQVGLRYDDLQGVERRTTISTHRVIHNGGTEEGPDGIRESISFMSYGPQIMT